MSEKTDEPKNQILGAAVELVKAVPVYQDAVQPLAKELGSALRTLGKTVNMVLAPLKALVWGWEQISEYVESRVGQILAERGVPPDRMKTPEPDVAVPALEAMRYSKLREQYAFLLATSIDRETAKLAHPAFVEILKQLTPDEARILSFLPRKGLAEPVADVVYEVPEKGKFLLLRNASMIGEDARCEYPELAPQYIDNLCRLGLTSSPELVGLFEGWRYERIFNSPEVKSALASRPENSVGGIERRRVGLTDLGEAFKSACLGQPDAGPGSQT